MADLQKELSDCKRKYKSLSESYIKLNELYGRLLMLTREEPCAHGPEQNCWHKNRAGVMKNFPANMSIVMKLAKIKGRANVDKDDNSDDNYYDNFVDGRGY